MDYKLASLRDRCARCDREFADGAVCFSMLDLELEVPLRRDFCEACFGDVPHAEVVFWRTRMREPGEPRRVVDFERLRDVFIKMVSHACEKHQELAYLMGLLLVRRRLFKLRDFATEGGRDVLVLSKPRSGEIYRVEAPLLPPERLVDLRDELSALMDGEIEWEPGDGLPGRSGTAPEDGTGGRAPAGEREAPPATEPGDDAGRPDGDSKPC